VIADRGQARLGAQYSNGRRIGVDGPSGFGTGFPIYEPGPISKIKTGANPANAFGQSDITIQVNAGFVATGYWLDPTPEDRSEPGDLLRTDFQWVLLHELGHGLGMISNRIKRPPGPSGGPAQGSFLANYLSLFDSLTDLGGNGNLFSPLGAPNPMFFTGPNATALNGGTPVPLIFISEAANSSGANAGLAGANFDHLGACDGPAYLSAALIRACYSPVGPSRPGITAIDLAILADLGIPIVEAAAEVAAPDMLPLFGALLGAIASHRIRRRGSRPWARERQARRLVDEAARQEPLIRWHLAHF